jgi:hypothetical protein
MEVTNFSLKNKTLRNNNPLLPSSIRGLIVGRSNCGKTVLLLNLLLKDKWLDYNNLLVFGNSLHQLEYEIIKKGFENKLGKKQILDIFQNQDLQKKMSPLEAIENYNGVKDGGISSEFYENCDLIPDPKTLDPKLKNLLILDDCYLGKQSKAQSYYTRGRHSNCDCFYISQNYFALPRNSVRENSNFIILFPQNSKSVEHIYRDHCTDISYQEFKELCDTVWADKFQFLTLDLTSSANNGKYRKNLETFYIPKSYKK